MPQINPTTIGKQLILSANAASARAVLVLATTDSPTFAGLLFTGTDTPGLQLKSLTTAQINTLASASALPVGSILVDSTTDRIDARLARGTVELVDTAGGQTINGTLTTTGRITSSANGAASTPAATLTGTWFSGGTSATTKPQLLIEPAGTTSTGWNTNGSAIGVNAASGFLGLLTDLKVNNSTLFSVNYQGVVTGSGFTCASGWVYATVGNAFYDSSGTLQRFRIGGTTYFTIAATGVDVVGNLTASGNGVFGSGTSFPLSIGQDAGRGSYLTGATAGGTFGLSFAATNIIFPCNATAQVTNTISLGRADYQFLNVFSQNVTVSGLLDLRKSAAANILQFSNDTFLRTDTSQLSIFSTSLARSNIALWRGGNFVVGSSTLIAASSGVDATGNVVDTSLSRNAAGVWQMGTTAANASGSLLLTNLTASGTVRLGTFTVGTLPSAAANTRALAFVTDSSVASFGAVATAGGALGVTVFSNGTNWIVSGGTTQPQKAITSGTAAPSGGVDGDIYLQYV